MLTLLMWYLTVPKNIFKNNPLALSKYQELENVLSQTLANSINSDSSWPAEILFNNSAYKISYTLNPQLENYLRDLLASYPSSYTSVVVLDNNSGAILAALDYSGKNKQFGKNLTFTPSSPAASIFKVITAADAIEKKETKSDDLYFYLGRATTLYKHQLQDKIVKYQRPLSLQKAFAQSNNVVFGKVALQHSDAVNLYNTASNFAFTLSID